MTMKLGTEIPGTSAEGNITTIWVPAIKNIKAPTIIELEAGTDISNYVMIELGRPTHFYDLDKIESDHLTVRWAREGEKTTTLNGCEIALDPYFGVICDGDRPECLAGIMGGERTSISDTTKDIFIESAFWHQAAIQGRCRRLNLFALLRDIATVENEAAELRVAALGKGVDRLGNVRRRIERHAFPGRDDEDVLRPPFADRHREAAADDVAQDIEDHDVGPVHFKGAARLERFKGRDDASAGAADPGPPASTRRTPPSPTVPIRSRGSVER
mgnify:CR=1 FL=1